MIAYRKKQTNNQGNYPLLFIEESSLRVSDNRLLRKIFGSKRDEITGEWGRPT
jgi:hypothetical protein